MTQSSTLPHTTPDFPDFHPVVLCTASRRVRGAEASEGGYIQGAADDHEAWSHGLTPALFWSNKDDLLQTNEQDLPTKIASLVGQDRGTDAVTTLIKPTSNLYVSASENVDVATFNTVISCTPQPLPQPLLRDAGVNAYLHLPCQTGKLGSRDLRIQLAVLRSLTPTASGKTLICCPTGKDLAVGTALAYLCLHVADDGTVDASQHREARRIDKTFVKQRLSWITTSNPALNPSRATLQSVNSALMSSEPDKRAHPQIKNPAAFDSSWAPAHSPPTAAPPASPAATQPPQPPSPSPQQSLFAALANTPWSFSRTLTSALPTHPSGHVAGTATFTPTPLAATLLYAESGEFATDAGLKFSARRRYVYELVSSAEGEDGASSAFIRVRFFNDDSDGGGGARRDAIGHQGEGVGGVFVEMGALSVDATGALVAENRAQHLCGEDVYAARWRFGQGMVGGEGERWWEVRYRVQGPGKEYVSTTRYTQAAGG